MEFEEEQQALLPPGFVFAPSDDLLVSYFLINKIAGQPLLLPHGFAIPELNLYDQPPWDLFRTVSRPCYLPADTFYCFVRLQRSAARDRRLNRKTSGGTWVANGTRCNVHHNGRASAGTRTALKFFKDGDKLKNKKDKSLGTDWIMHEYRLHPSLYEEFAACSANEIILCRIHCKRSRKIIDNDSIIYNGELHSTEASISLPPTMASISTGYLNDIVASVMMPCATTMPHEAQESLSSEEFADDNIAMVSAWMEMEVPAFNYLF